MRPKIALFCALALGLSCAKPLPTLQPMAVPPLALGADEWRVTDQVVVVTDASGTMYARQTFPQAKAQTRSFIGAMPAANVASARPGPYEAGLVSFGGDDRITVPLAPFDRAALAGTAEGLRILGDIDGMGGRTPYRHVIPEIGESLAGKGDVAAIVVFTDGLPDFPERALARATEAAEAYAGRLCFHTVQTGDDPAGTEFLAALAGTTACGSHRTAASLENPAAMTNLVRDVFAGPADVQEPLAGDPCMDVVRLRGIEFDFDKSSIRPESTVVLDVAADRLGQCPNLHVRIEGHTCSIGTDDYNQGLSERRADSVRRYFVDQGINPGRLAARGFGESQPIAPNDDREGRARNRRVELHPQP